MWNVWDTSEVLTIAIIGFVAGIVCYLLGRSHHPAIMSLAGLLAFFSGFVFLFAEETDKNLDAKRSTATYESCHYELGPGLNEDPVRVCNEVSYESYDPYRQPEDEPLINDIVKSFVVNILQVPAAGAGIVVAIGLARLLGAKGERPPLKFEDFEP